jgi:hypothetical protein
MLTIFTTQKPYSERSITAIHQANAFESWMQIPDIEVITLDMMNEAIGIMGLPYVNELFATAEPMAKNDLIVYANADLILLPDLADAMRRASEQFPRFLMVGQRRDVDLDVSMEFWGAWERELCGRSVLHSVSGKDWFGWCRPLGLDIPPFVVGRPMWDNKLLDMALGEGIPVIDATHCVTAIHPNHGYPDGWLYDEASEHNRSLCDVPANKGRISEATWVMTETEIAKREIP